MISPIKTRNEEYIKTSSEKLAKEISGEVKSYNGFDNHLGSFAIIYHQDYGNMTMWIDDTTSGNFYIEIKDTGLLNGSLDYLISTFKSEKGILGEIIKKEDEEIIESPTLEHNKSDNHINAEIHYIDLDTIEVTFSEPVSGYAICLLVKDKGLIYRGNGSEWLIKHNLQDKPFTQVFDMAGYLINCEIEHLDDNTTKISFFSGRDYKVEIDKEGKEKVILGDKIPYNMQGYAVLITEPTSDYIHKQDIPSQEWEIRHNLNNYCLVQLTDPNLYVKLTEIRQVNKSLIRASFSEAVSGRATCVTFNSNTNSETKGGVIVVDQYELPDVAEALTNTIYVLKQSGFAYVTNDNFQWITITPGPTRVDGNQYKDIDGLETDGNKWDNHTWEV